MNRPISTLILLLAALSAFSQTTFRKKIGDPASAENARWVQSTPDGGCLLVGSYHSTPSANGNGLLIRLDATGNVLWQRSYGGAGDDFFSGVCAGNDGGFVCIGQTKSVGNGDSDIWLLKVADDGTVHWNRTIGGNAAEQSSQIVAVPPNAYIAAGNSSNGFGETNAYWLRLDNAGNLVQSHLYNNDCYNLRTEAVLPSGAICAGGIFRNFGGFDGCFLRLDASGAVERAWGYGQGGLYHTLTAADGNVVLADGATDFSTGQRWAWMMKVDPSTGQPLWSYLYGNSQQPLRCVPQKTSDGGFLLVTWHALYNISAADAGAIVIKTDADGNIQWTKDYSEAGIDRLYTASQTVDGGYIFCGVTRAFDGGAEDIVVIKTDEMGDVMGCCIPAANILRMDRPVAATELPIEAFDWLPLVPQTASGNTPPLAARDVCSLNFSLEIRQPVCSGDGQKGQIKVTNTLADMFSLNGGAFQPTPVFSNLDTGLYRLTLQFDPGCEVDTLLHIQTTGGDGKLLMPNAFTPNGDLLNERFRPVSEAACPVQIRSFQVYSRWGEKVYERKNFSTSDPTAGWDGILNNKPAPAEVYVYTLEYVLPDGKTQRQSGSATLLR